MSDARAPAALAASRIFGWFDTPGQTVPIFDPLLDAPCVYCGRAMTPDDVRTISMLRLGDTRSYFYRVHRSCDEAAGAGTADGRIWNLIDAKEAAQ